MNRLSFTLCLCHQTWDTFCIPILFPKDVFFKKHMIVSCDSTTFSFYVSCNICLSNYFHWQVLCVYLRVTPGSLKAKYPIHFSGHVKCFRSFHIKRTRSIFDHLRSCWKRIVQVYVSVSKIFWAITFCKKIVLPTVDGTLNFRYPR